MLIALHYIYMALTKLKSWEAIIFIVVVLTFTALVFLYTDILNILKD